MFAGTDQARPVAIGGASISLGRQPDNDVVLADPRISGHHGRLFRAGEGYAYEDSGSRNGSLIERGGERVVVEGHAGEDVATGDRLLLGDLVSPVVITIDDVPKAAPRGTGETVVARHAVADSDRSDPGAATILRDPGAGLPSPEDAAAMRALFRLLYRLSGQVDPGEVMRRVAVAIMERFPWARSVTVLGHRQGREDFDVDFTRLREGEGEIRTPSRTLVRQAIDEREVIGYIPGGDAPSASVHGLAGAVLVPLLAGDQVAGVLHVDSVRRPFSNQDLAWMSIVGTHIAASLSCARRYRAIAHSEASLREQNEQLRQTVALGRPIIGESCALKKSLYQLERVARTLTTVLLLGETGTGKELGARYVWAHSRRAEGPFSPLNCAALPENLLESELFGYRKGAFTGATHDRVGLFQAADGGTVFLDEIGEITPAVQVRLLRVLQEREVQPVGATRPVPVDVRIVAATNRDLMAEVAAGRFREDLYYRLAVFAVELPPLRDRRGDVELLAERFREQVCARHDIWVTGFTAEALDAIRRFHWPGNVRQLEHEVERAVIMAGDGAPITVSDLSPGLTGARDPALDEGMGDLPTGKLREVMDGLERRVVRRCLEEHDENRTRAAVTLGISRQALQAKLARWKKLGL